MVTWIDDAHAIHPKMQGHTGGCIYFGKLVVHAKYTKNKYNKISKC